MTMKILRKKYLLLFVATLVLLAVGGYFYLSRGFSAKASPTAAEAFIARRLRLLAIPRRARDAKNPVIVNDQVLTSAMAHFADHCATCHANDGSGDTMLGRGLYPKPTDMRLAETQDLSDGDLYYIITNGIRFTGMPAFGEQNDDQQDADTWGLVSFIRHLPRLTQEELASMKEMNPRSPGELKQEDELERFLRGEDISPDTGNASTLASQQRREQCLRDSLVTQWFCCSEVCCLATGTTRTWLAP
jgi:mono/diheme cytochrome c family protein